MNSATGDPGGERGLLLQKGSCTFLKQVEILLSVMASTHEAVIINQVEFASPVFEPQGHQWFCEKPFQVWARKDWGRSLAKCPPGELRGYSVLWASSTGECPSLKKGVYWRILNIAVISELHYEIYIREHWQKIKVIEYCRESYRNIKYFLYRNGLLILQLFISRITH